MSVGQGRTISIVGAGVAGLSAACALARQGFHINIYERRGDPREKGKASPCRGSVLLTERALRALEAMGAAEAVRAAGMAVSGQFLHSAVGQGRKETRGLGLSGMAISRENLRCALLEAATRHDNVEVYFGQRCTGVDERAGTLRLASEHADGTVAAESGGDGFIASSLIIGADGAHSIVRRGLLGCPEFAYTQKSDACALKRAVIESVDCSAAGLDAGACHVWAGGGAVVTVVPWAHDGALTVSVHGPARGPFGLEVIRSRPAAEAMLRARAPALEALGRPLSDALAAAPVERIMSTRCAPWTHLTPSGAGIVLLGSSARGFNALFGLDAGAAVEDGAALGACVERAGGDLGAALTHFDLARRPEADESADALAALLVDLCSRSDSRLTRARAGLERALSDLFPGALAPRAAILTAPDESVRRARRRADRLDLALRALGVLGLILVLFVLVMLSVPAWPLLVGVIVGAWVLFEFARRDHGAQRTG